MNAIGKRFSALADYEVEVDDNGKIQKLKNHYIQDVGCSLNEPVQFNTTPFSKNCYDFKSWDVTTQSALTNSPSHTVIYFLYMYIKFFIKYSIFKWMRAPGTTEAIAMTENTMEHIARVVGKDTNEVRMANLEKDSVFHKLLPEFLESVGMKFNDTFFIKINKIYL